MRKHLLVVAVILTAGTGCDNVEFGGIQVALRSPEPAERPAGRGRRNVSNHGTGQRARASASGWRPGWRTRAFRSRGRGTSGCPSPVPGSPLRRRCRSHRGAGSSGYGVGRVLRGRARRAPHRGIFEGQPSGTAAREPRSTGWWNWSPPRRTQNACSRCPLLRSIRYTRSTEPSPTCTISASRRSRLQGMRSPGTAPDGLSLGRSMPGITSRRSSFATHLANPWRPPS